MISNKHRIIFITLLASGVFFVGTADAGTLSCTVATSCASGVVIYRMSGTTNAHAQLPSQSTYPQLVCCTGVTGLGNSCSGTYATALKLSGATNAHVQQNTQTGYGSSACISVPSGGSVSVGYRASDCTGYDTTLGSMTGTTNAHAGGGATYTTKICATAQAAAPVISITITTDGNVAYGTLAAGSAKSTVQLTDTQTVQNNGNITENFNIKGQNTVCPWTLAASAGSNQYKHEFSTNGGTVWTALTTGDQALASGIAVSGTQNVDLRVTVPTLTSCYTQQSVDVTITAVQP